MSNTVGDNNVHFLKNEHGLLIDIGVRSSLSLAGRFG